MNENSELLPNLQHEEFEMQMRGYSRRQVDEYVARRNNEIKELEYRLSQAMERSEQLSREMAAIRQQTPENRPAHEEVSERIGQILKLAEEEASAKRGSVEEELSAIRKEAEQESNRVRAEARERAERMLTAAQEQAERTISEARAEADKVRDTARAEADKLTTESRSEADTLLEEAKSQAKRTLDEATARASAIHDGAERRLNMLSTRHTETVRRLTDILDGVQGLVTAEAARMSLEDEVEHSVSAAIAALEPAKPAEGNDKDAEGKDNAGPGSLPDPGSLSTRRDMPVFPSPPPQAGNEGAPPPATSPGLGSLSLGNGALGNGAPPPANGALSPTRPLKTQPSGGQPSASHQDIPFSFPSPGRAGAAGPAGTTGPGAGGTAGGPDAPGPADAPWDPGTLAITDVPGGPGPAAAGPPDPTGTPGTPGAASPGTALSSAPVGRHATPSPRRIGIPPFLGRQHPPSAQGEPPGAPPVADPDPRSAMGNRKDGKGTSTADFTNKPDEPNEGLSIMR
ncbi:MAG: hypothetical protein J2P25_03275 [Nocardiopsaceae bacterium]|nr:hypothetical protein [Nocardiopsaceae bacterium]